MTTLANLKIGQSARVRQLSSDASVRHRLMEMGLVRGSVIKVVRFAPMGDPIDIEVRGYHLSLRKNEAQSVEVELESTP
jgi:Fe2+ transport system protein FeoA